MTLSDGSMTYFKFTPTTSGYYAFRSSSSDYLYSELYDVNGYYLYSESGEDFWLEYYCEAGITYVLGVEADWGNEDATIWVESVEY